jgi:hypothetical protein
LVRRILVPSSFILQGFVLLKPIRQRNSPKQRRRRLIRRQRRHRVQKTSVGRNRRLKRGLYNVR